MTSPGSERDYWDAVASDPERVQAEVYSEFTTTEIVDGILSGIESEMTPSAMVAELGCGVGRLLHALANIFPSVDFLGIDSAARMIALARRTPYENIAYWTNDGRSLEGLASGLADVVYSVNVFQHIPVQAQIGYLIESERLLKPGGVFRLQFVEGKIQEPLQYQMEAESMIRFASRAKLTLRVIDFGLVHDQWVWVTLRKPA